MLHASRLETNGEPAWRATDLRSGRRALRNEPHRGLRTAWVLLQPDVAILVNGDLVLRAAKTRGSERRHRALGSHDETLTATGEPAWESA